MTVDIRRLSIEVDGSTHERSIDRTQFPRANHELLLARAFPIMLNHFAREAIGKSDKIGPGAIERIRKGAGFADDGPALRRPTAGDVMAVVFKAPEIENLVSLKSFGEIRLVLCQILEHIRKAANRLEGNVTLVPHQTDARVATRKRNDPSPIARPHQVIRRSPSVSRSIVVVPPIAGL